jgi:hypothetical protein
MPRNLSFEAGPASPARRQRQGSPPALQQKAKRAKTAHFDSDDEAEAKAKASSSAVKGVNGKITGKISPALKLARKQEADRLLEGRKRLPVYEGELQSGSEEAAELHHAFSWPFEQLSSSGTPC